MKDLIQGAFKASLLVLLCTAGNAFAGDGAETIDTGTTAWMLTSTALVLLMIPGLAMFYGGLVRTKNVLGTMMHSFASMAIIGVIWMVCGYAMCFGENVLGGWFGWNPDYFLLGGIDESITGGIPEYVFAMFQCMFAMITPALIAGAFAERVKFRGYCIFIALWSIFVYNPLCHWVWAGDGFLYQKGRYRLCRRNRYPHFSRRSGARSCTLSWCSARISKNGDAS